jgi:predicted HTH transcriptional regulator
LDARVAHLYGLNDEHFAHVLETFPLVDPAVRQAALNEFTRMIDTAEAATFNPALAKPAAEVDPSAAVKDLIAKGESASLEFKSTARWNVKINQPDAKMERVIVKTVAAFLNAKGGTLIIGVEDDGKVYGLHEDYKLCGNRGGQNGGRDGFENWLMQTLMKDFGKDVAAQLHVEFHQLGTADAAKPGSADVCVVTTQPSPKPRFTTENGQELFYIRTGNATNQLKMSEFAAYAKQRWPEGVMVSA